MISLCNEKSARNTIYFPKTKLRNVSCVYCKRQFFLRDFMHLQGTQIPLLLSCGHAVCEGCVRTNLTKPCTLCGSIQLEDMNENVSCPLNIYVLGLIGLSYSRPIHADDPDIAFHQPFGKRSNRLSLTLDQGHCSECGIQAVLRCQQCAVVFCNSCFSKIHGKALQNHCPVLLAESENDNSTILANRCSLHLSEICEYYCNECNISACSHCMLRSHPGHDVISQQKKNEELIADFTNVYDKVAETLQRVHQTQKKLKGTLVFPNELQDSEGIEALISQHFAQLHGVLQNVEKQLVDKLYEQRNYLARNFDDIKKQLKDQEDKLQSGLLMAASAKDNINRVNLKEVIQRLDSLTDFPCHLVHNTITQNEKILFEMDKSVIQTIENHCKIKIPEISNFELLRRESLPDNYEMEPLKQEEIPKLWVTVSTPKTSSPTSSTVSVSSRRSDNGCLITGSYELVTVSHVNNPACFYVQRHSCISELYQLSESLNKFAATASVPSEVLANKVYLVHYGPDDKWYRGRVKSVVKGPNNTELYTIFYVDYGNIEKSVPISRLKNICPPLSSKPMMAIKCALHDIQPKYGEWDQDAKASMLHMINFCPRDTTMHIINVCGDTHYVDLCKYPSRDGDCPVSIRDALIFLEHGCFVTYDKLLRTNPKSVRKFFQEKLELEKYQLVVCRHVESPNCIYVQKTGKGAMYLEKLINDMTEEYKRNTKGIIYVPEIGMPCAAPFEGETWCRARISDIPGDRMVEVFYVDFGYKRLLMYDTIRVLHPKYMTNTAQAIKISLKDIQPLPEDNGEWNSTTNAFVKQRLEENVCKIIAFQETGDAYDVRLYISEDTKNINFNDFLVEESLARSIDPSLYSVKAYQKNSKDRKKRSKKSKGIRKTINIENSGNIRISNQTQDETDPFKIQVHVVRVESPNCIYVADVRRKETNMEMMANIQDFYNANCSAKRERWKENSVCVVYSARDKSYCRAKIIEIKSDKEVAVFFYDMAIIEIVSIKDIQPLHPDFVNIPAYSFKVKLAGILPCGGSSTWPSLSCEKLSDIINENQYCQFYISKAEESEDGAISVELWVKQAKTFGPLEPTKIELNSINRILVENGVALPIRDFTKTKSKILAVDLRHQLSQKEELSVDGSTEWLAKNEGLDDALKELNNSSPFTDLKVETSNSDSSEDYDDEEEQGEDNQDLSEDFKLSAWIPPVPIEDDQFIAVPTYLDHDCILYLHSEKQNGETLKYIEETLEKCYKNTTIEPCDMEWKVGDLCIAQYHDNNKWYRAQVLQVLENNMVQVVFVDYGNVDECGIGTLKRRIIMGNLPVQCTKCVIYGLNAGTPNGKWSIQTLDKIHALLVEKQCEITILQRKPDHLIVSITLLKPERKELISYLVNNLAINVQIKGADISDSDASANSEFEGSPTDTSIDVIVEKYIDETYKENHVSDTSNKSNITQSDADLEIIQCDDDQCSTVTADTSTPTKDVDVNEGNSDTEICKHLEDISILDSIQNTPWSSINCWEESVDTPLPEQSCKVYSGNTYMQIDIPSDIVTLELLTSYITDSTVFYAQFNQNIQSEDLRSYYMAYVDMTNDIQKTACEQPIIKSVEIGMPCCAQFSQDNKWYRSIINGYEAEKELVILQYVDYGNMEFQPINKIHYLKEEWLKVPVMSIKCKLWGVEVTGDTDYITLLPRLEQMLYDNALKVKIKERHDDVFDVELYSDKECIKLLYSSLIEEGLFQLKKTKAD